MRESDQKYNVAAWLQEMGRTMRSMKFTRQSNLHLHKADIVLTSTGASHAIITPPDLEEVIRRRRMRPMFLIDIAVPRDIDPAVNELDAVYLYDMDDLQQVVAANLEGRMQEADRAEAIIAEEILQFYKWVATLEVTPTIVALRNRFDELRKAELERTLSAEGVRIGEDVLDVDELPGRRRRAVPRALFVAPAVDRPDSVVRVLLHLEFVEPSKRAADLIIPEGGNNAVAIDLIITKLRSLL
jgi:glutamyl-tRNA reductase